MVPARVVDLPRARARFGERAERLVSFLDRVDPLADAAVAAIEELPKGEGWRLVQEGAAHGLARIPSAPRAIRDLFEQIETLPVWVDWKTLDRGGDLLVRAGPLGGIVLGVRSLVMGYASPAGNKPLVMSGRLELQAARRLNETARFVQAVCRRRGMRPHAEGWQITVRVRLIHAQVRRMILASGRWQPELWGAPVNQHDMAGTQLLFSLVVIEGLRALGLAVDAEEAESYMQLWRLVSHVIGVDPAISPASMYDATRLAELISSLQGAPDEDSRRLTAALLHSPLEGATTRAARRNGERQARFGEGMARYLLGDELSNQLGVPSTPWRWAAPVLQRLVRGAELVRSTIPFGDAPAILVGNRYWDRVVELGLAGAMAEFGLPEKLAAA
jgi:hypothetical protein